jgi:GMP synthase-like glutamine amidotransferase
MRVLAFRHEHGGGPGTVQTALEQRGIGLECVDLFAGGACPDVSEAAGLIFLGGGMCANDRLPFLEAESELIQGAVVRAQPVLGICLGAQLIARALGAKVYKSPVPEIGWKPVEMDPLASSDPVFSAWNSRVNVFQLHYDTFDLPFGAERLGHSPEVANQAFRWGRSVYGVQFHPEMTEEMVRDWSAESGLPEWPETPDRCIELARACDAMVGAWSTLL